MTLFIEPAAFALFAFLGQAQTELTARTIPARRAVGLEPGPQTSTAIRTLQNHRLALEALKTAGRIGYGGDIPRRNGTNVGETIPRKPNCGLWSDGDRADRRRTYDGWLRSIEPTTKSSRSIMVWAAIGVGQGTWITRTP